MSAVERGIQAHKAAAAYLEHLKDADCVIDPKTNLCTSCGVEHGEPCPVCAGRAFHHPDCSEGTANNA